MKRQITPRRLLMSLHPQYWDLYKSGDKIWELRKNTNAPRMMVDSLVIYATYPLCRIVGEVNLVSRHGAYIDELWRTVADGCCITRDQFDRYYQGHHSGVAYRLGNVWEYTPSLICHTSPQSWRYMNDAEYSQRCVIVRRDLVHPAT